MQHPEDTTVCEDGNATATFTCVVLIRKGGANCPKWSRYDHPVETTRHNISCNLTSNPMHPVYIKSILTVKKVMVNDNGAAYKCGILANLSNAAMLYVKGTYASIYFIYLMFITFMYARIF